MMLALLMVTLAAASPPDGVVPFGDQFVASMRKLADVDADAEMQCATSCEEAADFVGEPRTFPGKFQHPLDHFVAGFFDTLEGQQDYCMLEANQKVDRTDILHHGTDPGVERSAHCSRSAQQLLDDAWKR